MIVKRNDRRVDRTRRKLKKAFYELLQEKGYDQVSVEKIAERARIGRSTFYLHYKDKEDLLLEDVVELVEVLVEKTGELPLARWVEGQTTPGSNSTYPRPTLMVFQHAARNAELYRIVLRGPGAYKVAERLREIIIRAVSQVMNASIAEEKKAISMQVPMEVIANYYAGSILGLVTWWLENGMPYTPEEISQYFQNLFLPGFSRSLGFASN